MNRFFLNDLVNIFFPNLCLACGKRYLHSGDLLCFICQRQLPETRMHLNPENQFTDRFWGRVWLQGGAAMYVFQKGGYVQQLIHQLKYQNKPHIGLYLGEKYGRELKKSVIFNAVDLIIPVPIHPIKERKRGYNQSHQFAMGLSRSMKIPFCRHGLIKTTHGGSQTDKGREERYQGLLNSFKVGETKSLEGKHILIVDDVLTTGATLEACANKILEISNTSISMVTIAIST